MSFIITVYTNEGVVMASDSRTTYSRTWRRPDGTTEEKIGVQITDTTYKTFMCNKRIGISTCGDASINQVPIAGFIEEFIANKINDNTSIEDIPQGLVDYFSSFSPVPNTSFIVAGYNKDATNQYVYRVNVATKEIIRDNDNFNQGVSWHGEGGILSRLIKNVALKKDDGSYEDMPTNSIGYNYFTLQDAIDFAKYAVDITIKTMFFQDCVKTVGGPIDILVIKPSGAFWIQRKELHA